MFEFKNVDKIFPGVHALKSVNLHLNKGEVVGLVGENGAGKSTLMKIMYGAYQHDGGDIFIGGESVTFSNPSHAMAKGIGMVFQEQSLITNLTIMENIFLGQENRFSKWGVIDWQAMATATTQQLKKVKLDIDPATITSDLSFAQRQLVELAKVLTLEERVTGDLVILLDEPTSVLARSEVELLFDLVRELRSRASFIFVSHRMDEVLEISDRVYVLKDGEVVDEVTKDNTSTEHIQHKDKITKDNASTEHIQHKDEVTKNNASIEHIQRKMVGRDVNEEYYREELQTPYNPDNVLVDFDNVSLGGHFENVSLTLYAGQVLTLVGTEGSGREAIIRTIFGLNTPDKGMVTVNGETITSFNAHDGAKRQVGYVPRERKVEGIVGGMSVFENMTLSQMDKYSKASVLNVSAERTLAQQWIDKLSIKTPSEDTPLESLSGGNQQKVVLSKWRSGGANIMLLDHPTRGLDIGAKEDVYDMIRDMCTQGVGVILIADTLEEAIGLSHTIMIFKDGVTQKQFDCPVGNKPSLYDLIHHMV